MVARPNLALRLAVALKAPIHIQSIGAISKWHLIDASMTRGAADSFGDMNTVIEIDEIGKIVNSCPFDRPAVLPTFT